MTVLRLFLQKMLKSARIWNFMTIVGMVPKNILTGICTFLLVFLINDRSKPKGTGCFLVFLQKKA